jgi:hypothetical protein
MTEIRITRENLDLLQNLPANTTLLKCSGLGLTHLPDLPETLGYLDCDETLRTLYGFQLEEEMNTIREKVNRWNAENLQQGYVLK